LRLALRLAPEDRRSWIDDMAGELPHVAPSDRGSWLLGALALALRWRVASLQAVPRPQLAVAVLTAALLVGSPWLLRRYALQSRTDPVTTVFTDEARAATAERRDAAERSDDGVAAPAEAVAAEAGIVADEVLQSADADAQVATEALPATEAQAEPDAVGVAAPPAAPSALAAPAEVEAEAQDAATLPTTLRDRQEADLDGTLLVAVPGATVQLTALRSTEIEIRAGLEDDSVPLLDRRVEAGERFLLTLPSLVIANDGGALAAEAFGALGPDGVPLRLGFVAEGADPDEPPP
jgi:hypothetical protein